MEQQADDSSTPAQNSPRDETSKSASRASPLAANSQQDLVKSLQTQLDGLHLGAAPEKPLLPNDAAVERLGLSPDDIEAFDHTMQALQSGKGVEPGGPLPPRDLRLLNHGEWLNDEIVNAFMKLLQQHCSLQFSPKCHFFNSFFLPRLLRSKQYEEIQAWTSPKRLKRWGQNCGSILECDLVFFPYFAFSHWSLILVDLRTNTLTHYDSMNLYQPFAKPKGQVAEVMSSIVHYLVCEARDKLGEDWSDRAFELGVAEEIPQQQNGSDCGVFLVQFAKHISQGTPLTFQASHIRACRVQMFLEILERKIRP